MVGNPAEAEDLTQEAFLTVLRKIQKPNKAEYDKPDYHVPRGAGMTGWNFTGVMREGNFGALQMESVFRSSCS